MMEEQNTLNQNQQETLIGRFRKEYENALTIIDNDVKTLINQEKEMKALSVLTDNVLLIAEIHKSLNKLYEMIFNNLFVLERFNSERLKRLGYKPEQSSTMKIMEYGDPSLGEVLEDEVLKTLKSKGLKRDNHWLIKPIIIAEIEYMLNVLEILIEPDYVPLSETSKELDQSDDKEKTDRYIPPNVKISVWRRDQGKCTHCGSQEKLEYDHIIPISKGGSNTERNIQLLCEKCNREKSANIA